MKTKILVCLCATLGSLAAQNNLTTTATQRYFNSVRRNLEAAADVMPAEKYSFRLTPGQMTYAEWLIHSADRNYTDCAVLKGESAPEAQRQLTSLKEKAEVGKALKDSFAYCAAAIEAANDQKVLATPQTTNALLHVIVHNNEIYGNVVGYLRISGIVPPSTAARTPPKKGEK
jgi:uncharacterized damage-inducible protein DinB